LGKPVIDLNAFIFDGHMAAVEAYLQDGGRLSDFKRITSEPLNTTSPIEKLCNGGIRGLFEVMGVVHSPGRRSRRGRSYLHGGDCGRSRYHNPLQRMVQ
jgi:hypothetical protein